MRIQFSEFDRTSLDTVKEYLLFRYVNLIFGCLAFKNDLILQFHLKCCVFSIQIHV